MKVNHKHTPNHLKKIDAFVWYDKKIRKITSTSDISPLGRQIKTRSYFVLDRIETAHRADVSLVRKGDRVKFSDAMIELLPDRCKELGEMKVTHITLNGLIGTDKDSSEFDATNYKYFEKL